MNERASLNERGSGLVELALILPVPILTLAIVQFGVLGFAAQRRRHCGPAGRARRLGGPGQSRRGQAVAEAQRVAVTTFSIGQPQVVALAPGWAAN